MNMIPAAILTAAACLTAAPAELTLNQILAKHFEAEGGLTHRKALKSVRMTGHMLGGDKDVVITAENMRPHFLRVDVIVQGQVQSSAFDGRQGWKVDPFAVTGGGQSVTMMSEDERSEAMIQADIDGPLVDWAKKGNKVELLGKVPYGNGSAYKLKLTLRTGTVSTLFIDASTFLKVKESSVRYTASGPVEFESLYSDYRTVGGMKFPHLVEQGRVGDSKRQKLVMDKVELDPVIPESRFLAPRVFRQDPSKDKEKGKGQTAAPRKH